jgi:hypothetical protein
MVKPNFSECQLQQLVNNEIVINLLQSKNKYVIPKIPSLPEEYKLGWDTGFYFPWLGILHNPKHKGCNFFLQYKISSEIGKKGNQYSYWSAPYYRFQIPYTCHVTS